MSLLLQPLDPGSDGALTLIEELDRYLLALYPPESNHLDPTAELAKPHVRMVGAVDAGRLVGCGAVKLMDSYAEVKRVYVRPGHRGAGAGDLILNALEDIARSAGLGVIRLETGTRQPEALRLFARSGFTRTGPYADYPDDPLSVFMEKRLNPSRERA